VRRDEYCVREGYDFIDDGNDKPPILYAPRLSFSLTRINIRSTSIGDIRTMGLYGPAIGSKDTDK
jgi:hypothetical protein